MRVVFVWTGFTSYMADCWRKLAALPGVELRIWIEQVRHGDIAFIPDELMRGLDFRWAYSDEITDVRRRRVEEEIAAFAPDALFICGWAREIPPFVAKSEKLARVPKVLCCDMPWEWKPRKFAARFVLWRHLRRFKKILVPGKRAALYGRWLGFKAENVVRGEYAIDTSRFGERAVDARGFVFIGRLVEEKNIRLLARAYGIYRAKGGSWTLDVYGLGGEEGRLKDVDGIRVHGFSAPNDVPRILAHAGAFVLASKWDPWPLVLLESCAAGLPVICTSRCWDRYELIRENGTVVKSGDANALAQAMLDWERDPSRRAKGEKGRALAAPYDCAAWAERIAKLVADMRTANETA